MSLLSTEALRHAGPLLTLAIVLLARGFYGNTPHLFVVSLVMFAFEVWIVIEAGVLLLRRAKT